jgi:hypothetical protein
VKRTLAAAAIAGLAALSGCTASPAVEDDPSAAPSESATIPVPALPPESPETTAAGGGVKAACETFNALWARYAAAPGDDPEAYEEIYLKSEDAKDTAPEEVSGLFAALSLIAVDHAGAAETGGEPEQASKDAVRDAVFAGSGACTAEDVTLTL